MSAMPAAVDAKRVATAQDRTTENRLGLLPCKVLCPDMSEHIELARDRAGTFEYRCLRLIAYFEMQSKK